MRLRIHSAGDDARLSYKLCAGSIEIRPSVISPRQPTSSVVQPAVVRGQVDHVAGERLRAEAVGRRLASELRAVLEPVGLSMRSIRALARHLGVDANVCQRAVAAARCTENPLEALRRTPGPEGLDQLRRACARRGVDPPRLEALQAAVFELEHLQAEHGGSLIRLRKWLEESGPDLAGSDLGDSVSRRRDSYRSIADSLGCRVDTHAVAAFMRPARGRASKAGPAGSARRTDQLEGFMLNAYTGWRARPGAMPLVLTTYGGSACPDPGDECAAEETGEARAGLFSRGGFVLEEFSTRPCPLMTQRRSEEGAVVQVLDPAVSSARMPAGVDVAQANPLLGVDDPLAQKPPRHTSFVRVRYPTTELLLDVFMHRELAVASVPSGAIGWSGLWLAQDRPMPWYDRLPGPAPVVVTPGEALDNPCCHCPWYSDAIRRLASDAGWPLEEFVCHRLFVRFPLWGAVYLIGFDFSAGTNGRAV